MNFTREVFYDGQNMVINKQAKMELYKLQMNVESGYGDLESQQGVFGKALENCDRAEIYKRHLELGMDFIYKKNLDCKVPFDLEIVYKDFVEYLVK